MQQTLNSPLVRDRVQSPPRAASQTHNIKKRWATELSPGGPQRFSGVTPKPNSVPTRHMPPDKPATHNGPGAAISLCRPLPSGYSGLPAPTRLTRVNRTGHRPRGRRHCLALHAVGLAMPGLSPTRRCALTAPFHPCLCPAAAGPSAVCFLWRCPSSASGGWVGVTHHRVLPCSDFPPAGLNQRAAAAPRH